MTNAALDPLDEANACHHDDTPRAAELLRSIEPAALEGGRRPLLAFLTNHVIGEMQGRWPEASERQQALLAAAGEVPGIALLRQAGAAATLAGDAAARERSVEGLCGAGGCDPSTADALLGLAAASFAAPGLGAEAAGRLALAANAALDAVHAAPAPALDAAFAAVANNLAAELAERPLADLEQPALRDALAQLAAHAARFWQRAGTWVNHERAHYLSALAANALGDAAQAALEARAGLALLDAHDADHGEDVDRAFLQQELAHALAMLGDETGSAAAGQSAAALVATFGDAELDAWFARRAARNAALRTR